MLGDSCILALAKYEQFRALGVVKKKVRKEAWTKEPSSRALRQVHEHQLAFCGLVERIVDEIIYYLKLNVRELSP